MKTSNLPPGMNAKQYEEILAKIQRGGFKNNPAPYLTPYLSKFERQEKRNREVTIEEIKAKVDKQTLFLFAYVPFVIAEVAWDYADTCLNLAALMRLHETKPLCRRIKALRLEYDRKRSMIDREHRDIETDNMVAFQEDYKEYFTKLNISIQNEVNREHPGLNTESLMLISGAYSCAVVLRSMFKYVGILEKRIAALLGIKTIGSIIISEIRELERIILQFAGEESIGSNNAFPESLNPFISTLTNYLLQSEMIELPTPIE